MFARTAFAVAAIEAQKNAEYGLGYAIMDGNDRYFCGFRQQDGSLAHAGFRQAEGSFSDGHKDAYATDNPVFLSTADMRAQNVNAAVFGMIYEVNGQNTDSPAPMRARKAASTATSIWQRRSKRR
ncbi:MAG: hypothetical protein HYU57_06735 [Micavibrio aeruginosavorus]|nr:hypothetical protein [Micavibrio aeruginosavorus]